MFKSRHHDFSQVLALTNEVAAIKRYQLIEDFYQNNWSFGYAKLRTKHYSFISPSKVMLLEPVVIFRHHMTMSVYFYSNHCSHETLEDILFKLGVISPTMQTVRGWLTTTSEIVSCEEARLLYDSQQNIFEKVKSRLMNATSNFSFGYKDVDDGYMIRAMKHFIPQI